MSRRTKASNSRKNNLVKARKSKYDRKLKEKREFVLSVLLCGLTFQNVFEFLSVLGKSELSITSSEYYFHQTAVIRSIEACAKINCKKHQQLMKPGAVIGIDGSWDHRRNGKFCIIEAFDLETKKIVAYSIIERPTQKNKNASFKNAANQMEIEGVKKIISELKPLNKVIGYVHDKDAKTSKLIAKEWNITEYIDPNHSNKSFHRKFAKFNKGKAHVSTRKSLTGIEKRLSNFKTILTFSNYTTAQKEQLWLNVLEHFQHNHTSCIHAPYQSEAAEKKALGTWANNVTDAKKTSLSNFLKATVKYVTKVDSRYTSQLNECFHSVKANLASKNRAWGRSWIGRMAIAVLRFNEPDTYIQILRTLLQLPLFASSAAKIMQQMAKMRRRKRIYNAKRRTQQNKARAEARKKQLRDDRDPKAGYRFKQE